MSENFKITKETVKGIECKNVYYQEAIDGSGDDLLIVKEVIHTKDGQHIPRIRLIENYEREFFITKPMYQNHQQKKEYEDIEKVTRYTCTQAQMSTKIQMALGRRVPDPRKQLREVCNNPYVYMADITTPTILKAKYREKWPDLVSRNKAAILDIETNVLNNGHPLNEPVLITITMGEKKMVGIVKWYGDRIRNTKDTIHQKFEHYLSDIEIRNKKNDTMEKHNLIEERGKDLDIIIADKPGELFRLMMIKFHTWMADFLAIWNMNFDIPKLIEMLDKENIPLTDVFCDPDIPDKYRKVWYKQAKAQRETNSKTISQHPADLWHVLFCQAGFYVIDSMCLFKKIRTANGNEPSYSLDAILKKHLGVGKLKFKEVEGNGDLKWHMAMQKDYPAEYVIYNIFDCVSVELLDERTEDLAMTVSALADISEMSIFPSLPKRLVDILTYFYLERNKVPGTAGSQVVSELDEDIIAMTGWIVTLPAHMVYEDGLYCIEEIPELQTKFRTQTADDDLTQAYPTGGLTMNISKETTHIELCSIDGVEEANRRRAGINLTGGATNAIEICNDIMGMPFIHDVLAELESQIEDGTF